jgi:hypothetical protein
MLTPSKLASEPAPIHRGIFAFYNGTSKMENLGTPTPPKQREDRRLTDLTIEPARALHKRNAAGNFLKYGASEATFGSKNAGDLPVDSPEPIALCAPRLVFISYGIPERGDAKWLDHQGSYMATVAAQPVFQLLGVEALGISNEYHREKMPPMNVGLLDGQLAWRQHDGGHTDAPNMKYFIAWADRFIVHWTAQ